MSNAALLQITPRRNTKFGTRTTTKCGLWMPAGKGSRRTKWKFAATHSSERVSLKPAYRRVNGDTAHNNRSEPVLRLRKYARAGAKTPTRAAHSTKHRHQRPCTHTSVERIRRRAHQLHGDIR